MTPARLKHFDRAQLRDCLLTYEVYLVTDRSPDLGALPWPTPLERTRFMTDLAPHGGTCQPVSNDGAQRPVAAR